MKALYHMLPLLIACAAAAAAPSGFETTAEGVQYKDLRVGTGEPVAYGDVAVMHFVGWVGKDGVRGRELYNSRNRGEPISFVVGTDKVMDGWNIGVNGMRPGGQRLLLVPPAFTYGKAKAPEEIPGDVPLMFLIELLSVEQPG